MYYELIYKDDSLTSPLLNYIAENSSWIKNHEFLVSMPPVGLFKDSDIFKVILKFRGTPVIFNMNPMTWYDWHSDETRQCAINLLLQGYDSKCFFGDRQNRDIVNLTELAYEPNHLYLLDTTKKHAILNLSDQRYLLSIGFDKYNYNEVLDFCKRNLNYEH